MSCDFVWKNWSSIFIHIVCGWVVPGILARSCPSDASTDRWWRDVRMTWSMWKFKLKRVKPWLPSREASDFCQMWSMLVQGLSNGYDWRCFIEDVVGSIWNSKKFKRPGLEGEEAVRMTCNLSLQCIEAGCIAFPRSRQKLGRNEAFASEAYTIGLCWRDWPQCERWTRVRIAHITPRTIYHSNLLGIYIQVFRVSFCWVWGVVCFIS